MQKAFLTALAVAALAAPAQAQIATPNFSDYWNIQPLQQVYVLPPSNEGPALNITPDLPSNAIPEASTPAAEAAPSRVFLARPETPPVWVNPDTSPEFEAKVQEMDAHNRAVRDKYNETQRQLYPNRSL